MIDVNKYRTLMPLSSIQKTLTDFLNLPPDLTISIYNKTYNWGEEDYEADIERATELLKTVNRRYNSLKRHLSKPPGKKSRCRKSTAPTLKG